MTLLHASIVITLSVIGVIIGGVFWVVKAVVIMIVDYQPPFVFEVAPLLFAFGLLGLYLLLGSKAGNLAKAGACVAGLSPLAKVGTSIYAALPYVEMPAGVQFVWPFSLFVLIGNAGAMIGLLLLGTAMLRSDIMPYPWRTVPLIGALFPVPAAITAVLHFETPILLIGVSWIILGFWMWRSLKLIRSELTVLS